MSYPVTRWQRVLAWVALLGSLALFLWPALMGAEVSWLPRPHEHDRAPALGLIWPGYAMVLPVLALFAVSLLPLLVPTGVLRPEVGLLVTTFSRVALCLLGLLVLFDVIWISTTPLFD